jgi:AcrR family transcriptional regulator
MRFEIRLPKHRPFDESEGTLRVVKAAKQIFLRSAGTQFSIRGVAKEARMSMGAVQHFYPTRDKLIAAMLEFVTNEYGDAWEKFCRELPVTGEGRLMGMLDYLANDITLHETRHFFFALWALSSHNKFAAALQEEMYAYQTGNLAVFVGAARPDFSERECLEAAIQITAYNDGLMLFTAPGSKHFASPAALTKIFRRNVMHMLSADRADPASQRPNVVKSNRKSTRASATVGNSKSGNERLLTRD